MTAISFGLWCLGQVGLMRDEDSQIAATLWCLGAIGMLLGLGVWLWRAAP